jgi:NAD(P)H-dependent FMN reductase
MKIGIIIGSHRKISNSAKVGKYCAEALTRLFPAATTWVFDLGGNPLPLWDESIWTQDESWKKRWGPISLELKSCDAFVVVCPEYSGMAPAGLKNFFLLCSSAELGHKPGLIVSVSSGIGGSYPIVELRSSSYKNTRLNWIPDHVVVRYADAVLNSPQSVSDSDTQTRERLDYGLKLLREYSEALKLVRASGVVDPVKFPHGM